MRRVCSPILLACVALLAAGCGYHPAGHGSTLRLIAGKTIGIPQAVNRAYRPHLEVFLTDSLVTEFARRSGGHVLTGEGGDLTLTATITSYRTDPVAFGADDRARLYRATMEMAATLTEKKSGRVVWKGELSQSDDYPVNPTIALQQNSEEAAVREICARLAERLYQLLAEDF